MLQKEVRRLGEAEGRQYDDADDEIYCPPELPGGWNMGDIIAQAKERIRRENELNDDPVVDDNELNDDPVVDDLVVNRENLRNGDWLQKPSSEIFQFHRALTMTDEKMDDKMLSLLFTLQITSKPHFPNVLTHLEHIKEDDLCCLRLGSEDTPGVTHWLDDSLISTIMTLFTKTSPLIDNVVVYDPQFLEKCKSDKVPWKNNNMHEQILKKVFITVRISVGVNVMLIQLKPFLLLTEYNPTCTLGLRGIPISRRE